MFVLADVYEFDWPVTVKVPVDGGIEEQACTLRYRPLPTDEAEKLAKEIAELPMAEQEAKQDELLTRTIVGWNDIRDANGRPVAFGREALAAALRWPFFKIAAYDGYTQAITGQGARVGNSATPPAAGPAAAAEKRA